MITRSGELLFLADTSVNIDPTAEDLVEIALCAAQELGALTWCRGSRCFPSLALGAPATRFATRSGRRWTYCIKPTNLDRGWRDHG